MSFRWVPAAAITLAVILFQLSSVDRTDAQELGPERPLDGMVGELFAGSWISMSGQPTEENIANNKHHCGEPLVSPVEASRSWPKNMGESTPGFLQAQGKISVFKLGEHHLLALAASETTRSVASLYAIVHRSYRQKNPYAVISYLRANKFDNQNGKWTLTQDGKALADGTPFSIAVQTGLAKPSYALLSLGKNEAGRDVGLLYRPVTSNGDIIAGETRQYFRCGDIGALIAGG